MKLFNRLVDQGNTLIIIEHNLDVIKQADWIINIGPKGGKVVFEGTPEKMIKQANPYTAESLRADLI